MGICGMGICGMLYDKKSEKIALREYPAISAESACDAVGI